MIEAKINDPITLKIFGKETSFVVNGEEFEFNKFVVFGGNHYGFRLVTLHEGNRIVREYPTNMPIWKVQCPGNGFMQIHELNKNAPWYFTQDGKYIKCGTFCKFYLPDWEIIEKHVRNMDVRTAIEGINDDLLEKVDQVNKQAQRGLDKEKK